MAAPDRKTQKMPWGHHGHSLMARRAAYSAASA